MQRLNEPAQWSQADHQVLGSVRQGENLGEVLTE